MAQHLIEHSRHTAVTSLAEPACTHLHEPTSHHTQELCTLQLADAVLSACRHGCVLGVLRFWSQPQGREPDHGVSRSLDALPVAAQGQQ